jgi:hypothetical protein
MNKVAIKIGERTLKVGENLQSNNLYKMVPPFPNTESFGKKIMVEHILIIPVKENRPPKTTIAICNEDGTKVQHLFTVDGIKEDASVIEQLGYELLNVKPETSKVFGDMLGEL